MIKFGIIFISLTAALCEGGISFDKDDCAECKMTTASFLEENGYRTETHTIETSDEYLLTIFRIIGNDSSGTHGKNKVPVMMQHGSQTSSDTMVLTFGETNSSYATTLADHGYDVWLTNVRGSRYARHKKYTTDQFQYWNFTFDDISLTDIKTMADYILEKTGSESMCFVGHSLGALFISMLISDYPQYNAKFHYVQLMGPVVFSRNNKHYVISHISGGPTPAYTEKKIRFLEFLADHGLKGTFYDPSLTRVKLNAMICEIPEVHKFCERRDGDIMGFDPYFFPKENLELFLEQQLQGTGIKIAVQMGQISLKESLQKYDYRSRNQELYGSILPPKYKMSNIRTNIRCYYGKNDHFVSLEDAKVFFSKLVNANLSTHLMEYELFNHMDYFFGQSRLKFIELAIQDIEEFHKTHKVHVR